MAKKEEPMIFLEDGSILPWERPLPEGTISMLHHFQGSTKIKDYFGRGALDTERGPYVVSATAAVYLADIGRGRALAFTMEGDKKTKPEEEILFVGGIQIFKNGTVPGTKTKGLDLATNGHIWYAEKQDKLGYMDGEGRFTSGDLVRGLKHIILGEDKETKETIARIEMIVRGYKYQEATEERRQSDREIDNYRKGKLDALEHGGRYGFPF
ncbi:MAG: hypothetical protein V1645_01890 [archaeon]